MALFMQYVHLPLVIGHRITHNVEWFFSCIVHVYENRSLYSKVSVVPSWTADVMCLLIRPVEPIRDGYRL
jgi:hypothetical protein